VTIRRFNIKEKTPGGGGGTIWGETRPKALVPRRGLVVLLVDVLEREEKKKGDFLDGISGLGGTPWGNPGQIVCLVEGQIVGRRRNPEATSSEEFKNTLRQGATAYHHKIDETIHVNSRGRGEHLAKKNCPGRKASVPGDSSRGQPRPCRFKKDGCARVNPRHGQHTGSSPPGGGSATAGGGHDGEGKKREHVFRAVQPIKKSSSRDRTQRPSHNSMIRAEPRGEAFEAGV